MEVGLYTALVPMIVYAFFGTSRPLSVSVTSTIAMLTATELAHGEDDGHFHGEVDSDEPYFDELADGLGTVRTQRRRCTTRGVLGLSRQVAEEINCISPGSLVPFDEQDGIIFSGSAVLPYMNAAAREDFLAAGRATTLRVTSAYRSVVQQHMIYTWRRARRCSIPAAARPGRSPHESGRAVDLSNAGSVVTAMRNRGWVRNVRGDRVQFGHQSSNDLGELGILAFQRLWNRNNPNDLIPEDGDWGPATLSRVDRSPAEGFRIGPSCQ